jgi:broad specificity phosphatase PhoE
MTTFYIVRHGETHWNVQKLLQGHADSPLTQAGREQAQALAAKFAPIQFDHVFSSDLLRAKHTAELLTIEKQLAINTTELLRERSFGKYEGKSREQFEAENRELVAKFEALSDAEKHTFKYAPDMSSDEEVVTRLITFLRETAVAYPDKTILAVTHGGVLRVLLKHLGKPVRWGRGTIKNTAYIILQSDGIEFDLKTSEGIEFA